MNGKESRAQTVKKSISVKLDGLVDYVDELETDLLECKGTIKNLTAENQRLMFRLQALESITNQEGNDNGK
jgi:hypothetical protein